MKLTKLNSLQKLGIIQMKDQNSFGEDLVEWGSDVADAAARESYKDKLQQAYTNTKFSGQKMTETEQVNQALNERKQAPAGGKDPVVTEKKVAPMVVPVEAQMTFWHYLNDVKYVQFTAEELTKVNTWLITKAATYLVQKNSSGYYGIKKSDEGIPTLPASEHDDAFFELAFGKIPNSILEQIIAFFREVMKRHNDAEAFVQVYWDKTESKYIVHVPKQQISKASVRYDALENLSAKHPERYVFVYECHSHNSMNAFWSGTDNADEKELRMYGVFGQLNKDSYQCKHRFFVGEEQVDVEIGGIFDIEQAEKEKKYLVTHDSKQYLVPAEKLQLDEKPKYILTDANGKKMYVPLASVVLHRSKVDFPETWFGSVNVPLPSVSGVRVTSHYPPSHYTNKPYGSKNRAWDGDGAYIPNYPKKGKGVAESYDRGAFLDGYNPDDFVMDPEDRSHAETAYEMTTTVSDLMDLTNGFSDIGTTLMFIEELEGSGVLYDLNKHMNDYIGHAAAQDHFDAP